MSKKGDATYSFEEAQSNKWKKASILHVLNELRDQLFWSLVGKTVYDFRHDN